MNSSSQSQAREHAVILLVEDNANDAMLLQRAFRKAKILNPLHTLHSCENAMAYLLGLGPFKNRAEYPLPALILLDLKMPGMDGLEFLKWIRGMPKLRGLRVVVLTASDDMRDVNEAYQRGANSFLIKPADFERFVEISTALSGYWVWMDQAPQVCEPEKQDIASGGLN